MSQPSDCPYCPLTADDAAAPPGGWVLRDEDWLVQHGPAGASFAGTLKIISRRHYVDFAEQSPLEAASFGRLLQRLDTAVREVTGAERVHLVSTRDRVQHFHAWLYPRAHDAELRGTDYLAAPQSSDPADAERAAARYRELLGT